jgi:hypothetical protein
MTLEKLVKVALNAATAIGVGLAVATEIVDGGTRIAGDSYLKNIRVPGKAKIPGHLFKKKVVLNGYGDVVSVEKKGGK